MSPPFAPPDVALWVLLPPLVVVAAGGLVLLLDLLPPRESKTHLGGIALAGILIALVVAVSLWLRGGDGRAFRDMVLLDGYALFFDLLICYAAALVVMAESRAAACTSPFPAPACSTPTATACSRSTAMCAR